jgi:hypothetical protein
MASGSASNSSRVSGGGSPACDWRLELPDRVMVEVLKLYACLWLASSLSWCWCWLRGFELPPLLELFLSVDDRASLDSGVSRC